MDITKILENVQLSPEQIEALDKFFEDFTSKIKQTAYDESASEVERTKENAEKAFNLFKDDAEKAFNLFKEDAEKAFNMFEGDAKKAFELYKEDAQQEYTKYMVEALDELYSDIEARVKADFMESQEYKAIDSIKTALTPLIVTEDQKDMLNKISEFEKEKKALNEEKALLDREKIISTLLKDFPEQYEESVKKFISAAKTNDEIYERFDSILEMINIDPSTLSSKYNEEGDEEAADILAAEGEGDVEDVEDGTGDGSDDITDDSVVEEVTADGSKKPYVESIFKNRQDTQKKETPRNKYFSKEEEALISLVFPQAI